MPKSWLGWRRRRRGGLNRSSTFRAGQSPATGGQGRSVRPVVGCSGVLVGQRQRRRTILAQGELAAAETRRGRTKPGG